MMKHKNPDPLALAFAVASSMQNPASAAAAEGLQQTTSGISIPQALIAAAVAASHQSVAAAAAAPAPLRHGFVDHHLSVASVTGNGAERTESLRGSRSDAQEDTGKNSAASASEPSSSSTGHVDEAQETAPVQPASVSSKNNTKAAPLEESEKELDDNERRLARSRERNREHARRTRLRKKAQLEALQSKVKTLEAERLVLKQKVEECGIASILLGLSSGSIEAGAPSSNDDNVATSSLAGNSDMVAILSGSKRKRFLSEALGETAAAAAASSSDGDKDAPTGQRLQQQHQRLVINIDGQITEIGAGKSHMNWKTGVYRSPEGVQRQLTPQQLEDLRRERNRMHAKMTRSRKKCFIATIQKAIEDLEAENQRMRDILEKTGAVGSGGPLPKDAPTSMVTPATSPQLSPQHAPFLGHLSKDSRGDVDEDNYSQADKSSAQQTFEDESSDRSSSSRGPMKKRKMFAPHGFMLDG